MTFMISGTFSEFWDAAFYYNQVYSQLGLLERLKSVFDEFEFLMTYPGFIFGMVAWIVGFVCLIRHHANRIARWTEYVWFRRSLILAGIFILIIGVGGELFQPGSQFGFGLLQTMMTVIGFVLLLGGFLLTYPKTREAIKAIFTGHEPLISDDCSGAIINSNYQFPRRYTLRELICEELSPLLHYIYPSIDAIDLIPVLFCC